MFEREYLFNPFLLMTSSDEELSKVINELARKYKHSDLLMIYGEFIARLQESASLLKIEADNTRDKNIYKLRKDWAETSTDKVPAMSYFEAQAEDSVHDTRVKQKKAEAMLTRFKNAYSSLETKQNALKKKLETVRYE